MGRRQLRRASRCLLLAPALLLTALAVPPHRASPADSPPPAVDWADCAACHASILTNLPPLSALRPPATGGALATQCSACHAAGDLQRLQPGWTHPVRPVADHLRCTDCHRAQPHDAAHPLPLPRGDYKAAACYACHKEVEVEQHWPSHHGAEASCRDCHPAHAPFAAALPLDLVPGEAQDAWNRTYDWYKSNASCLRCHSEAGLMVATDRGFVVLNTVNYHAEHVQAGRSLCIECHEPHGSTRPALLRSRLIGGGVLTFVPRPTGGTCAVLCHGVDHRDWAYTNRVQ
jgi:predicted CXXCH cytochrome family protein